MIIAPNANYLRNLYSNMGLALRLFMWYKLHHGTHLKECFWSTKEGTTATNVSTCLVDTSGGQVNCAMSVRYSFSSCFCVL